MKQVQPLKMILLLLGGVFAEIAEEFISYMLEERK